MCVTRIGLVRNKTVNNSKLQRRQVAELLLQQKDESARIKVENVIRDDYLLEALDILELLCELVSNRIQLITESKNCPHDMKEAVTTLIYASARIDSIKELAEIRNQFQLKFGKDFAQAAIENRDLTVNQRVMFKLSIRVPEPFLCVEYMKEIARENNIEWDETSVLGADQLPSSILNSGGGGGGAIPPAMPHMGGYGPGGTGGAPGPGIGGPGPGVEYAPSHQPHHVHPPPPHHHHPHHNPHAFGNGSTAGSSPHHHHQQHHQQQHQGTVLHDSKQQQQHQKQQQVADTAPPKTYYSSGTEAPGYSAEGFQPHGFDSSTLPQSFLPHTSHGSSEYTSGTSALGDTGNGDDGDHADDDNALGGPNYDFDDLQKRFESLKKRK